ncbi:unnamed protein product [Mytilus coruscus]|uniref:Uncharacterized protein n=1 Tax=Mytilus coruscus TaxID=42192 RepID=A0A6J8C9N5_MYTCO|nr:unnamed protein product [Mytilus coruscus]
MALNLCDPEIKVILQNDIIEKHYSADCLPQKLVDPSTEKSSRCLYEHIDTTIYEKKARMVAYRTTHERLQPLIKALNLYFYEFLGKKSDKIITWVDNPQIISSSTTLKSITIDVKNNKEERLYKLTFFIKTGLIQVQGSHHHDFIQSDFPNLMLIIRELSGTLPTELNSKDIMSQYHDLDDYTVVKEVINTKASQHNINDTDGISCASGETTDIHVSHDQPIKLLPSTTLSDLNNNSSCIDKCDLERMESCFSNAILKLENSCMDNTDKIITALNSKIDTLKSTSNMVKSQADGNISMLENKLHHLKDELSHNKSLLNETREQLRNTVSSANYAQETYEHRIRDKNDEIQCLNLSVKELSSKLNISRDEIIELKMQLATMIDSGTQFKADIPISPSNANPTVLLGGTNNTEGINAPKLTNIAEVNKVTKYTMQQATEYLATVTTPPSVLALHLLTNKLKTKNQQHVLMKCLI